MKFLPEEGYKCFFVIFIYSIIGAAVVYGVFRYLFPAILPFLIAFPAAVLLRRPTLAISRHTKMPRKIVASLLAILFVSLLLGGIDDAHHRLGVVDVERGDAIAARLRHADDLL